MQEKICQILREGNTRRTAAALVGIEEETLSRWLAAGAKGKEPYAQLYQAVKNAEEEAVRSRIAIIRKAAEEGNWQAAAWWLERKFPVEWGKQEKLRAELTGENGGPLLARVIHLTDEELQGLLGRMASSVRK